MRTEKGFSLIELLIVVGIILIIAAIAIPSLMKSKMAANDSAAVETVRTLITAEETYQTAYPNTGFAGTLSQLGPGAAACVPPGTDTFSCITDQLLGCAAMPCVKAAYKYWLNDGTAGQQGAGPGNIITAATPPNAQFTISGTPLNTTSGSQNVCAFSDGIVRSTKNAQPFVPNPPILGADVDFPACSVIANYGPVSGV